MRAAASLPSMGATATGGAAGTEVGAAASLGAGGGGAATARGCRRWPRGGSAPLWAGAASHVTRRMPRLWEVKHRRGAVMGGRQACAVASAATVSAPEPTARDKPCDAEGRRTCRGAAQGPPASRSLRAGTPGQSCALHTGLRAATVPCVYRDSVGPVRVHAVWRVRSEGS